MFRDLRQATRLLAANPGFTAVSVLTLALGIGATTAIFSVIDAVLLRRAPLADLDRLAVAWETDRNTDTFREPASLPDYIDYRERSELAEIAAFMAAEVNFQPEGGDPVRLQAMAVTAELLPLLGVHPLVGRGLTPEETRRGGDRVLLLSEGLWTRSFGRDPSILGRAVRLDDERFMVVGILPEGSDFGMFQILRAADYSRSFADRGARASVDLWIPLQEDAETMPRSTHPLFMVARLATGAEAAQEELAAIAADLERAHPENDARGIHVEPLDAIVFGRVRPAFLVLLAAVGLVLLVAWANVANLLLARATRRQREVAVRMAMGAGGFRLARQFAAEGLVLTLTSAACGVGLAVLGVRALVALAPADIPRIAETGVDARVLLVTLAVSVAAGLAFGCVPILQAFRTDLQEVLKSEGGRAATAGGGPMRSALIVGELALAVILLVGAMLLVRSFWRLQEIDPGFRVPGVLKAEYQLPPSRYPVDFDRWPNFTEMHAFTSALLSRAAVLPGVEAVAVAGNHPLDPGFTNSFTIVGREAEAEDWPEISVRRVTGGYFAVTDVPLVRGRLLRDSDATDSAPVAVLNEAAARRFFGDGDPLGHQIRFWGTSRSIVGVVGNERFHGLTEAPPPAVYVPLSQAPSATGAGVLLVRTAGDPAELDGTVRAAFREVDRALAVFGVEPMRDTLSRSFSERRFIMLVLGLLAGAALVLAAAGVYGVLSYLVSQRAREIGIRVALGARPAGVRRLVMRKGILLAGLGASIGLAGALMLSRFLGALLFEIEPADPVTFIAVPLLLASVALLASYVPARRATAVDPVSALRE